MTEDFIAKSSRLKFRFLKSGDEKLIFPEIDEDLTKYWIGWEPSKNLEEEKEKVKEKIKFNQNPPNFEFITFDSHNNFIGCCGISPSEELGEFEINLWVKHTEQGRGYGKEMLNTVIDWAKNNSNLSYLVYSYTEGNESSAKIIHDLKAVLFREVKYLKRGVGKIVYDHKIYLR
jgi:RimJ/RimL family protein N-acetyltransferase